MVYGIYGRPWFRDDVNYKQQPNIQVILATIKAVPEVYRHLFDNYSTTD